MNLQDYDPSLPVEDRRGETYYGRQRPRFYDPVYRNAISPQSLLDMLRPGAPVAQNYALPAAGMAEALGYNQMGRRPMPPMQSPDPLTNSPAAQMLYRQRMMGGTGGPARYPGDQYDY
jgi:hypothetical protein